MVETLFIIEDVGSLDLDLRGYLVFFINGR